MKTCILYEERGACIHCGDCLCEVDPEKICDNCMKCVNGDSEYRAITISGILLPHEQEDDSYLSE